MDVQIPELNELSEKVSEINTRIDRIEKLLEGEHNIVPLWSSLRKAWDLKQGCAWETMRTRRWLQPKGGMEDGYIGGVKVFSRETIIEWMTITDDKLENYHAKYKTGAMPLREIA